MERAFLVNRPQSLDAFTEGWDRLYFGNDLCARLLPSIPECDAVLDFAAARGLPVTFLTPLADSLALHTVERLLRHLGDHPSVDEIVANDYGVLVIAARSYPRLRRLVGRALSYGNPASDTSGLAELGVTRVEYDLAVLERLTGDDVDPGGLPRSAYYPYAVGGASRYCPSRAARREKGGAPGIQPCHKECLDLPALRVVPDPRLARLNPRSVPPLREITLKGNSLFVTTPLPPEEAARFGVSRVVFEPELPV